MTIENQILDAVIQDHKERKVLGLSPFGDIFFTENDGYGGQLYLVCQILTRRRRTENPSGKGEFMVWIKTVALTDKGYNPFAKSKSDQ